MKGLIYRDLITFYRRITKGTYIQEFIFFFIFLLVLRNRFSCITYLLCVLPLNMSSMPTVMKEMDVNLKGMRAALLYPVSMKELVGSRYLSVFLQQLYYVAIMLVYVTLHFFIYGTYSFGDYLMLCGLSWMLGILFASFNLIACFGSSLNTAAIVYMGILVLVAMGYFIPTIFLDVDFALILQMNPVFLLGGACLAVVLIAGFTYLISIKILTKQLHKA